MAIRCGHCGGTHPTVADVRACHRAARPATTLGRPVHHPRPPAVPVSPPADLAGPDVLGRWAVVTPGSPVPAPWAGAERVRVDDATVADPAAVVGHLLERWHCRDRVVIELATALDAPAPVEQRPPWELPATFAWPQEQLRHLVRTTSVDLRDPAAPRWPWAEAAVAAGARPGGPADVVLPDGRPAWCDGGPLAVLDAGAPVLHRVTLERGSLVPLGEAAGAGPAGLAADQLAAVTHPGAAARIIAPAGSGKTRVLTERARHLLTAWQVPASALTLVAFNTRAADELRARTPDLPGLQIRTLNALGLALLDGRPPFARRGARFTVLDERDVRRVLDTLVVHPKRMNTDPLAPWLDALSLVRLGLRPPREVEAAFDGEVDGLPEVLDRYRAVLADRHALDFDEQITGALEALLREPATREAARRSCRILLVDEFQDLTPAHLLLVRLLAGPDGAVFGVGDDDQTIYGYTGATPAWLIDYRALFPGAGDHPLEVNYRCPPAVVTAAANLLSRNRRRVPKSVRPSPDHPGAPDALDVQTVAHPLEATVTRVRELLGAGAAPATVAVLCRVHASLAPVQVALAHHGVPVRSAVDVSWVERTGVRAALAWLRLATAPGRLAAADIRETARRPARGRSATLVGWMAEQRTPERLRALAARLPDRDGAKVDAYADDLEALVAMAGRGATTPELLGAVRERIGLDEAMATLDASQRTTRGSAQADDLDALVALGSLQPDPGAFTGWLRAALAAPAHDDGVVLATVHAVKGREYDHVILHDVSTDQYPHRLSTDREEERRIFHVGLTRGRATVTVVAPARRPSPFLAELTEPGAPEPGTPEPVAGPRARPAAPVAPSAGDADPDVLAALREWRRARARADAVPAYIVCTDRTLIQIATALPRDLAALARIPGIGPTKLDRYGDDLLAVIDRAHP